MRKFYKWGNSTNEEIWYISSGGYNTSVAFFGNWATGHFSEKLFILGHSPDDTGFNESIIDLTIDNVWLQFGKNSANKINLK